MWRQNPVRSSPKADRAIGRLLFYSGVRIAELVALDDDDVPLSARKGKVIVRSGKGETSREIPLLDGTARPSITEWRTDRASWPGADTPALFLNRRGGRLSARGVDQLMDELATYADILDDAGALALSAHILRHTLATNLLRAGVDIVVVAELLGHTRRYTLPPRRPRRRRQPSPHRSVGPPLNWANSIACTWLHESYRHPDTFGSGGPPGKGWPSTSMDCSAIPKKQFIGTIRYKSCSNYHGLTQLSVYRVGAATRADNVEDQVSRTILVTGATGETGRINSDDAHTVTGRGPVTFAESAAAAAGAWRR